MLFHSSIRKRPRLVLSCIILVLINIVQLASPTKLSFKESLTAYAEEDESPPAQHYYSKIVPESTTATPTSKYGANRYSTEQGLPRSESESDSSKDSSGGMQLSPLTTSNGLSVAGKPSISLWTMTKSLLHSLEQKGSKGLKKDGMTVMFPHTAPATQQAPANSHNETSRASNTTNNFSEKGSDLDPPRSKKAVGPTAGLSHLMWTTAQSLWSVNKEHFLPTFLHTKTGGKLSLIRDSIFKPITILSQFTSGVREINNEKWRSLSRLTPSSPGTGWAKPVPQVLLVKLQPQNSHLVTLLRYLLRLTKHTVITKYKLKRALLDLHLRAIRKLLRIIANKNISQKVTTIKILTSAAWKGKLALLRIFAGNSTSPHPTYYPGADNSVDVDLTYGSLGQEPPPPLKFANNYYDQYYPPPTPAPPPPPPPPPPPLPPRDSYHPLSLPPSPDVHTNYYHNPADTSALPLFPPAPSISFLPPPTDHLIESPSYASALKIMGINPTNYKFFPHTTTSTTAPPSPSSTVVYFSSCDESPHKRPLIEKPLSSYSYHFSSSGDLSPSSSSSSAYLPIFNQATSTEPSSFRLKLLEAMRSSSAGALPPS